MLRSTATMMTALAVALAGLGHAHTIQLCSQRMEEGDVIISAFTYHGTDALVVVGGAILNGVRYNFTANVPYSAGQELVAGDCTECTLATCSYADREKTRMQTVTVSDLPAGTYTVTTTNDSKAESPCCTFPDLVVSKDPDTRPDARLWTTIEIKSIYMCDNSGDWWSDPDPYLIVYERNGSQYRKIGTTTVCDNTNDCVPEHGTFRTYGHDLTLSMWLYDEDAPGWGNADDGRINFDVRGLTDTCTTKRASGSACYDKVCYKVTHEIIM